MYMHDFVAVTNICLKEKRGEVFSLYVSWEIYYLYTV